MVSLYFRDNVARTHSIIHYQILLGCTGFYVVSLDFERF